MTSSRLKAARQHGSEVTSLHNWRGSGFSVQSMGSCSGHCHCSLRVPKAATATVRLPCMHSGSLCLARMHSVRLLHSCHAVQASLSGHIPVLVGVGNQGVQNLSPV